MAQQSNRPLAGQPMPRMTDNMANQAGPGPQSLKLAALSANSYHLDSPPFTGTAGPLGEQLLRQQQADDAYYADSARLEDDVDSLSSTLRRRTDLEQHMRQQQGSASNGEGSTLSRSTMQPASTSSALASGSHHRSESDADRLSHRDEGRTPAHGANAGKESGPSTAAPSRRSRSRTTSRAGHDTRVHSNDTGHGDVDVPRLDLDEARHSTNMRDVTAHLHSSSLSPPPFSSASMGPPPHDNGQNGNGRMLPGKASPSASSSANGNQALSGRALRQRESSRPLYTQISDGTSVNGTTIEDAASSSAFDGEADADFEAEEVDEDEGNGNATFRTPKDGEVDGDDRPFILRSASDGAYGVKRMPLQSQTKDDYRFPRFRLPTRMRNESKIPLVIVACGSFSPPTYLHLRIFEMAKDRIIEGDDYELMAGYYSPVSDYYKKEGLAKATHRVRMCELAVEKTSTWLMVDAWESLQDEYQRTAVVLDHFHQELNCDGGVLLSNGKRKEFKVMLLAGGDLIQSMGEPGVWADADLNHILGEYGCMIVERTGADVSSFVDSHDLLHQHRKNLPIVKQTIFNDISSSKVRLFVRRGRSIKYLLPNSVIHYIEENELYQLPKDFNTKPFNANNES